MTQEYIGTKQITAWPALKDGADGYGVKYSDGYTSWSPKAVFEAAYLPLGNISHLPPHQQRVIGEKAQLDGNLAKLRAFLMGRAQALVTPDEFQRLTLQADAMGIYSGVLAERIAAFGEPA